MYNHSYKGFKNKKRKISYSGLSSFGGGSKLSCQKTTGRLRIIRFVVVVLTVVIFVGSICAGFIMYGKSSPDFPKSTLYSPSDNDAELLRVVNRTNTLEEDYVPELKDYGGYSVSVLAVSDLEKMLSKAEKDGVSLYVRKAYVSFSQQNKAYKKTYRKLIEKYNLTEVKAQARAQIVTPQGGKSEYQTGLLIFLDTSEKRSDFALTKAFKWLEQNCTGFGFVVRYPEEKQSKTSMKPNLHIFRYVGRENARLMQSLNMCLDEYNSYLNSR